MILVQPYRVPSALAKGLHKYTIFCCWASLLLSMRLETTGGIMTKLTERLPDEQTKRLSWSLGLASVSMVTLGDPVDLLVRWSGGPQSRSRSASSSSSWWSGCWRPQASKCPARHLPCILCLLLHRGLLAYLPICVQWPEALENS